MADAELSTPITWNTSAIAKAGPMMVVHPDREVIDDDLSRVAAGTGLNGPFVADLLASCAAHERTGLNLFKALEARSNNPAAKRRFSQFQTDAITAVGVLERLMEQLGVPLHYASPPARMTEAIDSKIVEAFLLTGAADDMTIELKGIEAVMLASTMCLANTALLRSLAQGLDEGSEARKAFDTAIGALAPVQEEHLEWAVSMQQEMVLGQARSSIVQKAGAAAEAVVGKVRDVLGR